LQLGLGEAPLDEALEAARQDGAGLDEAAFDGALSDTTSASASGLLQLRLGEAALDEALEAARLDGAGLDDAAADEALDGEAVRLDGAPLDEAGAAGLAEAHGDDDMGWRQPP